MAESPNPASFPILSDAALAARAKGRLVDLEGAKQAALLGLPVWQERGSARSDPNAVKFSLAHLVAAAASVPESGVDALRASVLGSMGQAFLSLMSAGVLGWERDPAAGVAAEALLAGLPLWAQRAALGEALAEATRRSDGATADWALTRGAPLSPAPGSEAERASMAMGGFCWGEEPSAILSHDFLAMASDHSWPAMAMALGNPQASMLDALASHGILDAAYFATLASDAASALAKSQAWSAKAIQMRDVCRETGANDDASSMARRQASYQKHIVELWREARRGILRLHPWSLFPDPSGLVRWAPPDEALSSEIIGSRFMRVLLTKPSTAAWLVAAKHAIARGWAMSQADKIDAALAIAQPLVAEAEKLGKLGKKSGEVGASAESEARVARRLGSGELAVANVARTLLPSWPSATLDILDALARLAEREARALGDSNSCCAALDAFARWIPVAESMGAVIDFGAGAGALAKMAAVDANAKLIADLGARGATFTSAQSADILVACAERGLASCIKAALGAGMAHGLEAVHPRSFAELTPLFVAAERGHLDCVENLLANGARWEPARPEKHTALDLAAANGHDGCAALLFKHGARARAHPLEPKSLKNIAPATSLSLACAGGHVGCANILLDAGALIDERDHKGFTALARASEMGAIEAIRALLDRGAQMETNCSAGASAADVARHFRHSPTLVAEIAAACLASKERQLMAEAALAPSAPSRKVGRI